MAANDRRATAPSACPEVLLSVSGINFCLRGFVSKKSRLAHVSHNLVDRNLPLRIQRGTKRYVNLAKQDPGKARQSS